MSLGKTFEEKYLNFFKFFSDSSRTLEEIDTFIQNYKIPVFSSINRINLNMIDTQNLNILFHIIRKSRSDEDCLSKLKLLIEKYHVEYKLFDGIQHRTLPYYTCVRGYLKSTKYLIEKMDYKIEFCDSKAESLFFSAIRSFNLELVEYLDQKYKNWIYFPNNEFNSCIYYIFKKSMIKEGEEKIKNLLRFIIRKGFDLDEKNNQNVSFKELCSEHGILEYLEDVLKEFEKPKIDYIEEEEKKMEMEMDNDVNINNMNINNNEEKKHEEKINEPIYKKNLNIIKIEIDDLSKNDKNERQNNKNKRKENNLDENKMEVDNDNLEVSFNNITVSSIEKNKKDENSMNFLVLNKNNDMLTNHNNEDFYSFSEYGLYNNNMETEKRESQKFLNMDINENEKIEKKGNFCVFIQNNKIKIGDIEKIIENNEKLHKFKKWIIYNGKDMQVDRNKKNKKKK